MNKPAKQYYQSVYRAFPTHSKIQKKYFKQLKDMIERYSQQNPEDQLFDYIDKFGEPQDIVDAFYERVDSQFVISQMKIAKIIRYHMIIFGTLIFILFACFVYLKYQEYVHNRQNQPYYYDTIIEEEI